MSSTGENPVYWMSGGGGIGIVLFVNASLLEVVSVMISLLVDSTLLGTRLT